jgi:exodeoxyribonuclease V beta subunit
VVAAVAAASPDAWEGVHQRLHQWARVLRLRSVASLMETITLGEGLPTRVLATTDGERRLTDLRHVAQLLHAIAMDEHLRTTALAAWLRKRIAGAPRTRPTRSGPAGSSPTPRRFRC